MAEKSKKVVITGVSTGIGHATAKTLIDKGFRVFGSVRKKSDADRLQSELGDRFKPLIFDVTDDKGIEKAADQVRAALAGQTLAGLVNNAGIALGGPLLYMPLDQFRKNLEVNLTGVVGVTQAFAPLLGADQNLQGDPGRIVNIGSVGGRHAFPFMGPYHTSKFGLEGLTESLRRELMIFGIDAILVAPGSIATPIWEKGDALEYERYDQTIYKKPLEKFRRSMAKIGKEGLPPEKVADVIVEALTTKNPKVYYRLTDSPLQFHALTKLPKRWVDSTIARTLGLERKSS